MLYLERTQSNSTTGKSSALFVVSAYHTQTFLSPGGACYGACQDKALCVAHELVSMNCYNGFYTKFSTSMVNKSGIRPHHYAKSQELAIIAQRELENNLEKMVGRSKLRLINALQLPFDAKGITPMFTQLQFQALNCR